MLKAGVEISDVNSKERDEGTPDTLTASTDIKLSVEMRPDPLDR